MTKCCILDVTGMELNLETNCEWIMNSSTMLPSTVPVSFRTNYNEGNYFDTVKNGLSPVATV